MNTVTYFAISANSKSIEIIAQSKNMKKLMSLPDVNICAYEYVAGLGNVMKIKYKTATKEFVY